MVNVNGDTDVVKREEGPGVAVVAQVGLGPLKFSVWATFFTLPAKCSIKCSQEKYF